MTTTLHLLAAASTAALAITPITRAQNYPDTYHAEWCKEGGAGSGCFVQAQVTNSVSAMVYGSDFQPWNAITWHSRSGLAISAPGELRTAGGGGNYVAVAYQGVGTAEWFFDDVVFSDGRTTPQPVAVQMSFDVTGASSGLIAGNELTVFVYRVPETGPFTSWSTRPGLSSTPQTVTGTLSLMTNTRYAFKIRSRTWGQGGNNNYSAANAKTVWNDPPFTLPTGVTANSAEAGIVNNVRTINGPAITPLVTASSPTVAGQSTTVSFSGGQAGSPGAYFFGLPPNGSSLPVVSYLVFNIPLTGVVSVLFTADTNGEHNISFPVDPSLSGASLGVQAAQVYFGPPNGIYSTNAWQIDIK